jgi:hypothetical protein
VTSVLLAAAFGDQPEAAVRVPPGASPRDRWLAGVVLGGQGRYAAAAAVLRPLLVGRDPVIAAHAGATLASHLRQLGGHALARRHDAAAARRLADPVLRAGPPDDPEGTGRAGATVDVLLGLSADAIGLARTTEADRLLAAARRAAAAGAPGWRVTVRIEWLATELALATRRAADAVSHAERAQAVATDNGATRHLVKSIMMTGASWVAGGTPDGRRAAERLLAEALGLSLTRGMLPLAWPCALLLADLAPDRTTEFRKTSADALTSVFSRSDAQTRRVAMHSAWVPTALIRSGEPTRTSGELTT